MSDNGTSAPAARMILLSCHSLSMECLGTRSPPVTLDVDATFVLGGNRHGFGKAIQRAVLGDASQQFELPRIRVFAGDGAGLQDPAGVHGTGRPSGGTNPATGLVLLQSDITLTGRRRARSLPPSATSATPSSRT